jgi:hypothetical protein
VWDRRHPPRLTIIGRVRLLPVDDFIVGECDLRDGVTGGPPFAVGQGGLGAAHWVNE